MIISTEDFSSYTSGAYLPNGSSGGSGWSSNWAVTSSVLINAQSGSWANKYASFQTSGDNFSRSFNFPASGKLDVTFQAYRPNGSALLFCGIALGGNEYKFVFGAGGAFNQFRYNGNTSGASDPIVNGTVHTIRIWIDTTTSTNNVIFYVDGVAKATYSTNITNTSSPSFTAAMSGYGSGCAYGNISITDGVTTQSVTVSSTVLTATFSAQAPTVTAIRNVTISPTTQSAVFSTQAPVISGGAGVSVGVVSATFSIPLPNIITPDALVNASVVSAAFSTQAPSVTGQAIVSSSVLSATFSQPSASFVGSVSISPNTQSATFSVQNPDIYAVGNVTVSASAVSGTFSIQNPTITAETFAEAGVVSATFSTLSVTVTTTQSVTVDASVMTATFSVIKPLRKVGGLWTAQPRNEGVWVPQGRVA